jgi:hypothetical protein
MEQLHTMHIHHTNVDKKFLLSMWDELSKRDQIACEKMFGKMKDLLDMTVDWDLIKAIAWFWDAERRCFVINDEDFCPILEEYEAIFKGDAIKSRRLYAPYADIDADHPTALRGPLHRQGRQLLAHPRR